jgi:glycosyltransferase involved in cell wall biosynthesis
LINNQQKVYLNATNISRGGGKSLLISLIKSIPDELNITIQIDERLDVHGDFGKNITLRRIRPTLFGRLSADYWLRKRSSTSDLIICFGSLPLFFGAKARQIVFIQNLYLIEGKTLRGFSLKTILRIWLERFWFNWAKDGVKDFVVQSQNMRHLLLKKIGIKWAGSVYILPFSSSSYADLNHGQENLLNVKPIPQQVKFIYVASGEPHKNHKSLIAAWKELSRDEVCPLLFLTINPIEFKQLCNWIDVEVRVNNLNIINLGSMPHEAVLNWYGKVDALIYPSLFESFGLPLIDALNFKLPVIASELDYVRDIFDPTETFDPNSPTSIARAVRRFLKTPVDRSPILNPSSFMEKILVISRSC